HTPGLLLAEIRGPDHSNGIVFCADLIPGRPCIHLTISLGYVRYPEKIVHEHKTFPDGKLARDVWLLFTHDHACASARVARDERGRFTAVDTQPELTGAALGAAT